jgi:hypothetical protein
MTLRNVRTSAPEATDGEPVPSPSAQEGGVPTTQGREVSVLGHCVDLEIGRAIAEDVGRHRTPRRLRTIRVR